ncbi:S8 family serine peptidase [Tissierella sp. MSJ-40]|uniref:S8 family serine peptidase n=1 Tax=Tissierella simiarum TaxID=2841534 RepID=A0ABS6E3Y8_9FIRM|nr:S8 family serine peptidase [Tissierella simiarum]MBU5436974.1 S8 family serine peptidase [Tissierella simiarum]
MFNFKSRKSTSLILALFMVLNLLVVNPMFNISYGDKTNIDMESIRDSFRETLEDSKAEESIVIEELEPEFDEEEIVTFIIELDEKSVKDFAEGKSLDTVAKDKTIVEKVLNLQIPYKEEIKKINDKAEFNNEYTLLFNGFSVETKYGDKKKIEKINGIRSVTVSKTYYRDVKNAVDLTGVAEIWEELGYDGRGKIVAVLDSGIDHNHKDMVISEGVEVKLSEEKVKEIMDNQSDKRGKYFTEKVPFGYNYADRNLEIIDTVVDDPGYAHGMHVSGIIGGNCQSEDEINNHNGVKGIAPEVQILAMKIFSNNARKEGASEANIINAIEDAVTYGADVINMSFCSTAGFQDPKDGQQIAIQGAMDQGIIVVSAAGNVTYSTYPKKYASVVDTGVIGAPGIAQGTIQVASFENNIRTAYGLTAKAGDREEIIGYVKSDFDPLVLKDEYKLVDCGLGRIDEENEINDFEGKDLEGKIALVKRGETEFKDKKLNAQEKGAVGVIIYNEDDNNEYLDNISTDPKVKIPTIFITNFDGLKLKNMLSEEVRISFNGELIDVENSNKGDMSSFSSWGPTPNFQLKPDITSVGGTVWSTVNHNGYKSMSGTSMATPHVSGMMILMLDHLDKMDIEFNQPKEKVEYGKTLIMNTAEVKIDEKSGVPYSPRRQGAGFANVQVALENKVVLTYNGEPSISLKEIGRETDIPLTLFNGGDKPITYTVDIIGGVLTEQDNTIDTMSYDVKLEGADLTFDKNEVIVEPGNTATINSKLTIGQDVSQNRFVEGFIRFTPRESDVPTIGIPFMGFYGDWDELKIIDELASKEDSIYKETSLFTTRKVNSLTQLYPLGGKDMNPELFAINPDDTNAYNNVLPKFSLLRNAKQLIIDVTNEEGEVIKVLEDREKLRKEVVIEQQIPAKVNFQWNWNGQAYDRNQGIYKTLGEGQYYINIRAKVDYENAKEQVTTLPLKIDKTLPEVKASLCLANSNECTLEMEAEDKGEVNTGIEHFLFLINGKKYEDENGNKIFTLEKSEDGKYRMKLNLPENLKEEILTVHIGVTDYADNMGIGETTVIYIPNSQINVNTDKIKYAHGEDIKIEYRLLEEKIVDHYEIYLNDLDNPIATTKELSHTITGLLEDGFYKIIIKALGNDGNLMGIGATEIAVGDMAELEGKLLLQPLTKDFSIKNREEYVAQLKAANYYEESKDITFVLCLYDENNKLVNAVAAEKNMEPGKVSIFTNSITIPDNGDYILKMFIWDSFDTMNSLIDSISNK